MIEVTIAFCNFEMFQCIFATFNAFEALDFPKRVFLGGRLDGHLG